MALFDLIGRAALLPVNGCGHEVHIELICLRGSIAEVEAGIAERLPWRPSADLRGPNTWREDTSRGSGTFRACGAPNLILENRPNVGRAPFEVNRLLRRRSAQRIRGVAE